MTVIGRWGLAAGLFALAMGSASAQTAIPLATWGGQSHVGVREFPPAMERALKELEPHGIKFQHFPGGQLGQDKDMPVAIPTGQVKFGWITVNGWSGTVRDSKVMDAPTGLSMAQLDALIDKPGGLMEQLQKAFQAKNSVLLGLADLGPPALVSKVPLLKPADFKGKKIRVFSEGLAEAVRALGGSPVQIPFADVYTAMQYGTVDAAILGFQGVESQRMYEVGKYVLVPASFFGTTMMGWAANKTWFDSLPEADRKVFVKAVDQASRHNRKAILEEIEHLTKNYRDRGMTVTFLTEQMPEYAQFKTVFDPVLKAALKQLSPPIAALVAPK
ncbi:TRAP transporter substrate-binding protein [Enterovirga rhinocerotis]|uniref:TRAP-type C4-dicarboxylate transport system substrate-binding protein n=1 Tax=Enterovirga rhinocerotis TaxID=1339210 RepID=A0A4R7C000_9HYPH|nr:TRAP transporter substrate-binding protein [Enterovirga rhinocerotis]TDR90365.1 TRAP-type C4-dicarboxylate transport system substrate-binding protein [Enterovirga rhinocerotis]